MTPIRQRVLVVLGTRPEAIKLAPVVVALRRRPHLETVVLSSGQHREMLAQVLGSFGLQPDHQLGLMAPDQGLADLTTRGLAALDQELERLAPRLVVVQGDTTTTFTTALAAFYRHIAVAHVEAGLRSFDLLDPFPEEMNRRATTLLAAVHLAPTPLARRRLLQEGVDPGRIAVTGNTVVDALLQRLQEPFEPGGTAVAGLPPDGGRMVLVTSHRREAWGEGLASLCDALRELAAGFPQVAFVYPVHLNPNVRRPVERALSGVPGVHLLPPVGYREFLHLMQHSHCIVTDSGGVQEEAPTLRKPLLLVRRSTERPEAFEAGVARLVGRERQAIVAEVSRLLSDAGAYRAMVGGANPYGDGRAGERVAEAICRHLAGETPLLPAAAEFDPTRPAGGTAEPSG